MLLPNFKQIKKIQLFAILAPTIHSQHFTQKKQNSHLPTQTLLPCSNLLLKLGIFSCLLLQLSSDNLTTFTNAPFSFLHVFFCAIRDSPPACLALESRQRFVACCMMAYIYIYVNSLLYLLISHQAVNFSELDKELSLFLLKKAGNK